ncbi:hypothetical protein [uncultured Hymenobacter sp.]|uniref:hypothetical protein n=1 Tax=uncultured Hymenobacter sp. TaxID=170016 RepID=UPI0035C997DE
MRPLDRRIHRIASTIFFFSTALYLLPNFYGIIKPLRLLLQGKIDYSLLVILLLIPMLFASLFLAIGLGIRRGKVWAKGLFLLYPGWFLFTLSRDAPYLAQHTFWDVSRLLLILALQFTVAFFLFKGPFTRRKPIASDADSGVQE